MADSKVKKTTTKKTEKKEVKAPAKKASPKKTTTDKTVKYAVIEIAGSQMLVEEGRTYETDNWNKTKGENIVLESEVLLVVDGEKVSIGKPSVKGAKVTLEVESAKRGPKLRVFKYKAKSRYRRTYGHRSELNRFRVKSIKTA